MHDAGFGSRILQKYGWTSGKGLGKHLDGITRPLCPTACSGARGIGYERTQFDPWWDSVYDSAARRAEIRAKCAGIGGEEEDVARGAAVKKRKRAKRTKDTSESVQTG